jgi:diacylglycerol kinase
MSKKRNHYGVQRFLQAFRYALEGLKTMIQTEVSFRIQIYVAVAVFVLLWVLEVSRFESILVAIMIFFVLGLEGINSTIEAFLDYVKKGKDPDIKKIKDIGAAAVLIASIGATIVGILVFLPRIIVLF